MDLNDDEYRVRYYGMDGQEVTRAEWIEGYMRDDARQNRVVQQDEWFEDGQRIFVSTVLLGIDHAFHYGDPHIPIIFETMIFGGPHDQYQTRYATKEQAAEGHQVALAVARGEREPDDGD